MLWKFSKRFQFAAEKLIPDSFVFCVILTILVYIAALILTDTGPISLLNNWYTGFWDIITLAFQMSFMVIACGAAARAPQFERVLQWIASKPKSRVWGTLLLLVCGTVASFINWAFCLILTPILAMHLSKNIKGLHFPLLIAIGFSTMLLGQSWSPSSTIYALVASEDHFLFDIMGTFTQAETVYNPINTSMFLILFIVTVLICILTVPPKNEVVSYGEFEGQEGNEQKKVDEDITKNFGEFTLADRMNGSRILMYIIGIAGLIVILYTFLTNGILSSLDFNFILFIFLTLNMFLYSTPRKFVGAFRNSMKPATEVLLQFPFYGGLMGLMTGSGLTVVFVDILLKFATVDTFPLFSYISAAFINLFVPSQGGQWIVQGPIMVEAANAIGADLILTMNAFQFGDQLTNLLQPLYIIPALAVVKMKLKDVWGFMAFICTIWFVVTCLGLYLLPKFIEI